MIAVLPLVDSQNVALGNSSFDQMEIALQLSASFSAKGATAAANALNDYVKQKQSELNTRNSIPVVTSYTDGTTFGFEIYPSLIAQTDPGNAESKPGFQLQPITFPAVVAILIEKKDLGKMAKLTTLVYGSGSLTTLKKTTEVSTTGTKTLAISGNLTLQDNIAVASQSGLSIEKGVGTFILTNANSLDTTF